MIITDGVHLVSTESVDELHAFATSMGLWRSWYQNGRHPHYDLTTPAAKLRAIDAGAVHVTRRDLVKLAWWRSA